MSNKQRVRRSALPQGLGIGLGPRAPLVHPLSAFPYIYRRSGSVILIDSTLFMLYRGNGLYR